MAKKKRYRLEDLQKAFRVSRTKLLELLNDLSMTLPTFQRILQEQVRAMNRAVRLYAQSEIPREVRRAVQRTVEQTNASSGIPSSLADIQGEIAYDAGREMQQEMDKAIRHATQQLQENVEAIQTGQPPQKDPYDQIGRRLSPLATDSGRFLREIGIDAARQRGKGIDTQVLRNEILERLQEKGFLYIEYHNGNKMPVDAYANMVARTTLREAGNLASIEAAKALGYDLVICSEHWPTCEVCAPLQGRVFSISGEDKRFPYLFDLPGFTDGFYTLHPNCRHVFLVTIESQWTDQQREQYLADAGNPIKPEKDVRTADEVNEYNRQQAENRRTRQDLYQWERYKQVLGEDAPKRFSDFRRLKNNKAKWEKVELDYARRRKAMLHPEVRLPGAEQAFASDEKFTGYFFNPDNAKGFAKGRAFSSHLGYNKNNWKLFRAEILQKAQVNPAVLTQENQFGRKYNQLMILYGEKGDPMDVKVVWIVEGDAPARLVTAYPN